MGAFYFFCSVCESGIRRTSTCCTNLQEGITLGRQNESANKLLQYRAQVGSQAATHFILLARKLCLCKCAYDMEKFKQPRITSLKGQVKC